MATIINYLETIGACARQHFVDAQHVEGVDADPDVELVLGGVLHHVLQDGNISLLDSGSPRLTF